MGLSAMDRMAGRYPTFKSEAFKLRLNIGSTGRFETMAESHAKRF